MKIERVWAMPNKWTFNIKPIDKLLKEEMGKAYKAKPEDNAEHWIDPFAGKSDLVWDSNDINPKFNTKSQRDALIFLKEIKSEVIDGVLFDPPYSPRQIKE